jgi:8-oxo-dGTP pyrophosphatase MutT (NUDIX family)
MKESVTSSGDARSAVLILLLTANRYPLVLFTRRSLNLPRHKGEISFPGGVCNSGEYPEQTALRELEEEVGLCRDKIQICGSLDNERTGTGYVVAPFVGIYPYKPVYRINSGEVDRIIEIPLNVLIYDTVPEQKVSIVNGHRQVYPVYWFKGDRIWGATARMLCQFLAVCETIFTPET